MQNEDWFHSILSNVQRSGSKYPLNLSFNGEVLLFGSAFVGASDVLVVHVVRAVLNGQMSQPVLLFSNLNEIFFGYFDPEIIYLDNKNNYFSG